MRFIHALVILVIGAGFIGVVAIPLSAQEPVYTLRVDVPLVSVDVKVLDSRDQPLTSLTAKDFIVLEDGAEQDIQVFTSIDTPNNILLLFDRSGSTQDQWTFMQRAASRFIRNLRPQDHVALAAFDEGVMMLSGWNETPAEAERALEELQDRGPGGGTNLYQSLERIIRREFRNTTGRRALVVLTDGRDSQLANLKLLAVSRSFERTVERVRSARVPIYFVALNTDKNLTSSNPAFGSVPKEARLRMETLADVTGGGISFPKNIRDIVEVYDQVSRDLSSSYGLAYTSTHRAGPGQYHRIQVRVHGARVKQSRDGYTTP
jgi:VWFA-related protein